MGDCQTGPQGRAMAAIKAEQRVRPVLIQTMHYAAAQVLTGPGDAQPLALEAEKREFVQRVSGAEPIIEFETIDDADGISEPDVLRTQITVSVSNAPAQHPIDKKIATSRQEPALH